MDTETAVQKIPVPAKRKRRRLRTAGLAILTLSIGAVGVAARLHRQSEWNNALIAAVQNNDSAGVSAMMRRGADPNTHLVYRILPATPAEVVQWIIGTRSYVWHSTPVLTMASSSGCTPIVTTLLDAGANVDETDQSHWTPLMSAAGAGHGEVVRLLIRRGVSVNARNVYGNTALTLARINHRRETAALLTQAGARE